MHKNIDNINLLELTPVQRVDNILVKRNDLFIPFGKYKANGDKLRQAIYIIKEHLKNGFNGIITGATFGSPQPIIVGTICYSFNIPYITMYGGTNIESLKKSDNFKIMTLYNPSVKIAKCARSTALYSEVNKLSEELNYGVINYGMAYSDDIFELTAVQIQNIPDNSNIIVVCGSGNTAKGIICGLSKYNIAYQKLIIYGVAPNRLKTILEYADKLKFDLRYEYIDLFSRKGFNYDKEIPYRIGDIQLHPRYEAKAFREYITNHMRLDNELFYINGAKIYA